MRLGALGRRVGGRVGERALARDVRLVADRRFLLLGALLRDLSAGRGRGGGCASRNNADRVASHL